MRHVLWLHPSNAHLLLRLTEGPAPAQIISVRDHTEAACVSQAQRWWIPSAFWSSLRAGGRMWTESWSESRRSAPSWRDTGRRTSPCCSVHLYPVSQSAWSQTQPCSLCVCVVCVCGVCVWCVWCVVWCVCGVCLCVVVCLCVWCVCVYGVCVCGVCVCVCVCVCVWCVCGVCVVCVLCVPGTTSEEGVIFVYGVFMKPVSAVECTVYTTAIFKQHAIKILRKYLPLYSDADRRDMLAQVSHATSLLYIIPQWLWQDFTFQLPSIISTFATICHVKTLFTTQFLHPSAAKSIFLHWFLIFCAS